MPSELAWVDTSEDERRRMREVIDLFRERDTLDELGIGSVRDTFADYLFPGLSTIQTRARYFLFVPWVYQRLETDQTPSAKAGKRARRVQTDLVDALVKGSPEGETGIIGRQAREAVQRLPSSVYWSGLGTYGLRQFHGSIEDYHRSLNGFHRRLQRHQRGEGDELHERLPTNWHPSLPYLLKVFLSKPASTSPQKKRTSCGSESSSAGRSHSWPISSPNRQRRCPHLHRGITPQPIICLLDCPRGCTTLACSPM